MNRKVLFLLIATSCIGFLAATWLLTRKSESEALKEIRDKHEWLAAEMFLKRLDYDVTSHLEFPNLDALSPKQGTLFFTQSQYALSSDQAQDLLDWVARGGHLVLGGAEPSELSEDPIGSLFFQRGLVIVEEASPGTIDMGLAFQKKSCMVTFQNGYRYKNEGEVLYDRSDSFGSLMLVYAHDAGKITLLLDMDIWWNSRIGEEDHAAFLERIILFRQEEAGPIWIVSGSDFPSLAERLYQKAWMVLWSLAFLLALTLWQLMPRLGPLLPEPLPERRNLMEHIEASGQFLWDHYCGEKLLAAVHAALMRRIRQRHPTWISLNQAELAARLGEVCGISKEEVAESLDVAAVRDPDQFQILIKNLVTMRSTL